MTNDLTGVVAWPKVVAKVDADGSAEVSVNGSRQTVDAADVEGARRAVIALVANRTAALLERPVAMDVSEPGGTWRLLVHPDGQVDELEREELRGSQRARRARSAPSEPGEPSRAPRLLAASALGLIIAIGAIATAITSSERSPGGQEKQAARVVSASTAVPQSTSTDQTEKPDRTDVPLEPSRVEPNQAARRTRRRRPDSEAAARQRQDAKPRADPKHQRADKRTDPAPHAPAVTPTAKPRSPAPAPAQPAPPAPAPPAPSAPVRVAPQPSDEFGP